MPTIISGDGTITGLTATGISAAQTVSASNITTGTLPKAQLPTGSVLQVVNASYALEVNNSTTTYADSNLTATITPTSASSKILVIVTGQAYKSNGNASNSLSLKIQRNNSDIVTFADLLLYTATANEGSGQFTLNYLDSPSSTSALTYKMQFKNSFVSASLVRVQFGNMPSIITLMEVAA
jgi:hypothetical protein